MILMEKFVTPSQLNKIEKIKETRGSLVPVSPTWTNLYLKMIIVQDNI